MIYCYCSAAGEKCWVWDLFLLNFLYFGNIFDKNFAHSRQILQVNTFFPFKYEIVCGSCRIYEIVCQLLQYILSRMSALAMYTKSYI